MVESVRLLVLAPNCDQQRYIEPINRRTLNYIISKKLSVNGCYDSDAEAELEKVLFAHEKVKTDESINFNNAAVHHVIFA